LCTLQIDEIDCEFMNANKHDCVSMAQRWFGLLGRSQRFRGFENLPVRSEGIWPCVYELNTAAAENTVEVDHQPTGLEC
jgi:hypothetical protein